MQDSYALLGDGGLLPSVCVRAHGAQVLENLVNCRFLPELRLFAGGQSFSEERSGIQCANRGRKAILRPEFSSDSV